MTANKAPYTLDLLSSIIIVVISVVAAILLGFILNAVHWALLGVTIYWAGAFILGRTCQWLLCVTLGIDRTEQSTIVGTAAFVAWPLALAIGLVTAPVATLLRSLFRR